MNTGYSDFEKKINETSKSLDRFCDFLLSKEPHQDWWTHKDEFNSITVQLTSFLTYYRCFYLDCIFEKPYYVEVSTLCSHILYAKNKLFYFWQNMTPCPDQRDATISLNESRICYMALSTCMQTFKNLEDAILGDLPSKKTPKEKDRERLDKLTERLEMLSSTLARFSIFIDDNREKLKKDDFYRLGALSAKIEEVEKFFFDIWGEVPSGFPDYTTKK